MGCETLIFFLEPQTREFSLLRNMPLIRGVGPSQRSQKEGEYSLFRILLLSHLPARSGVTFLPVQRLMTPSPIPTPTHLPSVPTPTHLPSVPTSGPHCWGLIRTRFF